MPSINDLVQVAESFEKSPVSVVRDRCSAVRNRNASCRKCVDVCQVDAIRISANQIDLDAGACMACGACTSVCPTGALVSVRPTDADLSAAVAETASAFEGRAVFACARIASKRMADPSCYAEVPCLARMEESLCVSLVSHGVTEVLLVDGECRSCKYRSCVPAIDATVLYANALLEAQGSDVRVRRASEFPADALVESTEGLFGSTRRGFFAEAAGAAKETAMTAARTTIEQELGFSAQPEASIGERLRVGPDGSMPRIRVARHDVLINAMDALGEPATEQVETRRFGSVSIDLEKCNACGMCAVFCSTGALMRDAADKAVSDLRYLEFSACECIQCGLCADVCWKGALSVSPIVQTAQLFDFEPVVFDLSRTKRSPKKLFGSI